MYGKRYEYRRAEYCSERICVPPHVPRRRRRQLERCVSLDNPPVRKYEQSGKTVDVVVKGKFAHYAHGAIGFFNGNGRHVDAIEPILLHHGVACRVTNRQAVTDLQRRIEAAFAEDVAGKTGLAANHVLMFARTVAEGGRFTIDEQVEHVGFGGSVDYRKVLAVVADIEHRDFERGAVTHRCFAGFEIHLHTVLACKVAQSRTEGVDGVARCREADATA